MSETVHADTHLQAHYQIDAMCIALRNAARATDVDALPFLVQSLVIRIEELNAAMMHLASEPQHDPEQLGDLHLTVYGRRLGEEVSND